MNLGDKVKFQKELKKGINLNTEDTLEFVKNANIRSEKELERRISRHPFCSYANWGVWDNEKVIEGIYCGKRMIDMTGKADYEGFYEFGTKIVVYLIATNVMGFHRVPKEFIISD